MRKLLLVMTFMTLMGASCAPQASTQGPLAMEETPTPTAQNLTPARRAAVAALSTSLGLPADAITLISAEAVEWPDECLGVQEEGLVCAQAITPGFRVILEADGKKVEYHTNEDGTQVRPAIAVLIWKREGGIAGFCDYMTVYLSGEVHRSSCTGGQYAEERLIDLLSPEEMAKLNDWVMTYEQINIDASDPEGVSDRMVIELTFSGIGSNQTVTISDRDGLLNFAQELYQRFTR